MMHWQGRRKPWRDWWNNEKSKPSIKPSTCDSARGSSACVAPAEQSVHLWWRLHGELSKALVDGVKRQLCMCRTCGAVGPSVVAIAWRAFESLGRWRQETCTVSAKRLWSHTKIFCIDGVVNCRDEGQLQR